MHGLLPGPATDKLVRKQFGFMIAVAGSALTALSLTGSSQTSATLHSSLSPASSRYISARLELGGKQYSSGDYLAARETFLKTADYAAGVGSAEMAATNLSNAGGAALARFDYRNALIDLRHARDKARLLKQPQTFALVSNNLASLYLRIGDHELAMQTAREALVLNPTGSTASRLRYQVANALGESGRFSEALPVYRQAIAGLEEEGDVETAARIYASLGRTALDSGKTAVAEGALAEALRLIRTNNLSTSANVLRVLARLKEQQGDTAAASTLFDRAVAAPQALTPRWLLYADRGEFKLTHKNYDEALNDFREASRLASLLRLDMVPVDENRITIDRNLSRVARGLVNAGNQLFLRNSNHVLLEETFDAAERDRLWSLQSLIPSPNDWRSRLPATYWDLLARYQKAELSFISAPSEPARAQAATLSLQLHEAEAAAGDLRTNSDGGVRHSGPLALSPLNKIRQSLDNDTVFISFQLSDTTGWVWAADQKTVGVWPIGLSSNIKRSIDQFTAALQADSPQTGPLGLQLYRQLFEQVDKGLLKHSRWLLELDGPLFELPFAALPVETVAGSPIYLAERAALQIVPSAMLLERRKPQSAGEMLAVGDAIYNAADSRFEGHRDSSSLTLPRLPATARELKACASAWGASRTRTLAGADASGDRVASALRANPSIIHFATHVIAGPGEFSSGMIALSMDQTGTIGLLGPREIIARPVTADLVVLNGCHSAQGQTIPGSGLMGLTRAWIGAGAAAVLATRWDIPDDSGEEFISSFYRELSGHWDAGPSRALQRVQIELLKERKKPGNLNLLGAYFLLGRA